MDTIPREDKRAHNHRRRLIAQPSWSLPGHLGRLSGLRCFDTAEVDVEIGTSGPAANVTMSTSGRVWHYSTGERCPKCSVHGKCLYFDPGSSHTQRNGRKLSKVRTYYYVGQTLNQSRHGWGRLMDDKRLICEGQHDHGVMRGFYLVYHEYSVEMGVTLPWGRVGVYLLADRDSSLAPFAYGPDGTIEESLTDPYVRRQKTRQGVIMELIGESLVAVSSYTPPKKSSSIKLVDEAPSSAQQCGGGLSKSLDFNYLCPTRRWRRETSSTRRLVGRSDDETIDSTKISSSDSLPPPPPSRNSQQRRRQSAGTRLIDNFCAGESVGEADDVTVARSFDEPVENLGSSLNCQSLGEHSVGSHRRPSATSESDCAPVPDCHSADDLGPEHSTRSASSSQLAVQSNSSCSCVCAAASADLGAPQRRNSWPRVGQHGDMRWAFRAFEASPLSPLKKQSWECPERLNFNEHRWRVTALVALRGKRLRGLSSWAWSSEDLARFLCAVGLPDLAYHFVHKGVSGYDLKDITRERLLQEFSVHSEATISFVLCAFRTLIAANDETDLLYPLHLMAKPRDCRVFGASEFVLRRRLGIGGHAVVYHATRPREGVEAVEHVALKCFPHNHRKKRVSITEPVPEELSTTPAGSSGTNLRNKMAGSFTSLRRWVRGNNNDNMPTIILSKVLSDGANNTTWQRSGSMDNLLYFRTGGERARDRELMVLQSLPPHPYIVECYGQVGGNITGIVLEFCDKGAIHDAVMPNNLCGSSANQGGSRESMSRRNIVKYFCEIANGLAFLHEAGFVHRDLKPSNFLISSNGSAKLSDFGMASRWRSINCVYLGSYGNIFYAAPEVLLGAGYWPESDIFSLGVSLWEALSKDGAYGGMSKGLIFCAVCTNQYMQTFGLSNFGCTELACLIERMLAFDYKMRPSAREVAQALSELLNKSHELALSRVQSLFDI